ncbi:MAG TPA: hypothetical protein VNW97_01040 [Candidatus Saccharimonadales bacterium]|jgi:DNA repair exonuclease SbcCD ATPase subunit|nr:hypothetical protein [Candidatus Saccharimonadales bacterium]
MKRIFLFLIACAGFMVVSVSAQQTLGDIARANRARKKPASTSKMVIDNDTMPSANLPEEAPAKEAKDAAKDKDKTEGADARKEDGKAKGDPPKDAAKAADDFKSKIEGVKKELAQLQRELDVSEREAKMRAATYYADAGSQLRNQAKFAEDTRNQQEEIDSKKQGIEAAKQKLADLQEQARKAGLPSSQTE